MIEDLLGIPSGWWQNQGSIYRIDLSNPENFSLRIPNGRETGANELWLPGGRTSGGTLEAVTDQIPQANITAIQVIEE
ncbi:MAG: hypothetical protein R2824_33250 [Saprospiraceae bacterium]|nr:hypothetical protein [Lewinella sp.]